MEEFCKVFNLQEGQVLLHITYDNDEGVEKLHRKTVIEGVEAELSNAFKEEGQAKKAMDAVTEEEANAFYDYINKQIKEN